MSGGERGRGYPSGEMSDDGKGCLGGGWDGSGETFCVRVAGPAGGSVSSVTATY